MLLKYFSIMFALTIVLYTSTGWAQDSSERDTELHETRVQAIAEMFNKSNDETFKQKLRKKPEELKALVDRIKTSEAIEQDKINGLEIRAESAMISGISFTVSSVELANDRRPITNQKKAEEIFQQRMFNLANEILEISPSNKNLDAAIAFVRAIKSAEAKVTKREIDRLWDSDQDNQNTNSNKQTTSTNQSPETSTEDRRPVINVTKAKQLKNTLDEIEDTLSNKKDLTPEERERLDSKLQEAEQILEDHKDFLPHALTARADDILRAETSSEIAQTGENGTDTIDSQNKTTDSNPNVSQNQDQQTDQPDTATQTSIEQEAIAAFQRNDGLGENLFGDPVERPTNQTGQRQAGGPNSIDEGAGFTSEETTTSEVAQTSERKGGSGSSGGTGNAADQFQAQINEGVQDLPDNAPPRSNQLNAEIAEGAALLPNNGPQIGEIQNALADPFITPEGLIQLGQKAADLLKNAPPQEQANIKQTINDIKQKLQQQSNEETKALAKEDSSDLRNQADNLNRKIDELKQDTDSNSSQIADLERQRNLIQVELSVRKFFEGIRDLENRIKGQQAADKLDITDQPGLLDSAETVTSPQTDTSTTQSSTEQKVDKSEAGTDTTDSQNKTADSNPNGSQTQEPQTNQPASLIDQLIAEILDIFSVPTPIEAPLTVQEFRDQLNEGFRTLPLSAEQVQAELEKFKAETPEAPLTLGDIDRALEDPSLTLQGLQQLEDKAQALLASEKNPTTRQAILDKINRINTEQLAAEAKIIFSEPTPIGDPQTAQEVLDQLNEGFRTLPKGAEQVQAELEAEASKADPSELTPGDIDRALDVPFISLPELKLLKEKTQALLDSEQNPITKEGLQDKINRINQKIDTISNPSTDGIATKDLTDLNNTDLQKELADAQRQLDNAKRNDDGSNSRRNEIAQAAARLQNAKNELNKRNQASQQQQQERNQIAEQQDQDLIADQPGGSLDFSVTITEETINEVKKRAAVRQVASFAFGFTPFDVLLLETLELEGKSCPVVTSQ